MLNWKTLTPLLIVIVIDAMGGSLIVPLLPFYSQEFGANALTIGMMIAAFSVCQFISGPFWGRLSDQYGRKKILLISQLGTFVSFIMLALAPNMLVVFAARMIDGLTSGNMSIAMAMASESSEPSTRKQALGALSAAIGVGVILGPSLSAFLAHGSATVPIWVAAGLSLVSMTTAVLLLPNDSKGTDSQKPKVKVWDALTNPATRNLLTLLMCLYFPMSLFVSGVALFLQARYTWDGKPFGPQQVGFVFTISAVMNIVTQFVLLKPISKWMSDRSLALYGFVLFIVSFLGIGFTGSIIGLGIFLVLLSLAVSLLRPTLASTLSLKTPPPQMGLVMGANQSLLAGANIIAPLISGVLIDAKFYSAWIIAMAIVGVVGFFLSRRLVTNPSPPVGGQ